MLWSESSRFLLGSLTSSVTFPDSSGLFKRLQWHLVCTSSSFISAFSSLLQGPSIFLFFFSFFSFDSEFCWNSRLCKMTIFFLVHYCNLKIAGIIKCFFVVKYLHKTTRDRSQKDCEAIIILLIYIYIPTRTHEHTRACAHTHTHTHTHIYIYMLYYIIKTHFVYIILLRSFQVYWQVFWF